MSHFLGPIAPILTDAASVQELNPNGGAVTNQLPSLKTEGGVQRLNLTSFNEFKNVPIKVIVHNIQLLNLMETTTEEEKQGQTLV